MRFRWLFIIAVLVALLGACEWRPENQGLSQATPPPTATATPTPTPEPAPPQSIRVWLPPALDPNTASHANEIVVDRIQAFASAHNITAEIRIKPLDGPAGMLTTLGAARTVAPDAVPDVVLFPRRLLEAAAIKGLAFPLPDEAFTAPLDSDDWFPYAQHLAVVQSVTYGVPFGGDALGLLYHPEAIAQPPTTWSAWLQADAPWVLPLGDPDATALLALYRAAGGTWQDETGRPTLDEEALRQMLILLQQAVQNERLSPDMLHLTSDHMLWARYQGEAQALMITYLSHLFPGPDPRRMAPIPASDGVQPLTLADGLLWAVTTPDPQRQELAVQLLAALGDPKFVAQWDEAAGFIPPRQSVLDAWESPEHRALVESVLPTLQLGPPQEVRTVVGPLLQEAAAQVVSGKQSPAAAAHWAVSKLGEGQ